MEERKTTTSAIISFAEQFEHESSEFYEKLAKMVKQNKEVFMAFAEEGRKNTRLIVRTYQETISDALEASFSFETLNPNEYITETDIIRETSHLHALETALKLEKNAIKFYTDLAECSKSLLATIPRAFRRVAEERKKRIHKLQEILDQVRTA